MSLWKIRYAERMKFYIKIYIFGFESGRVRRLVKTSRLEVESRSGSVHANNVLSARIARAPSRTVSRGRLAFPTGRHNNRRGGRRQHFTFEVLVLFATWQLL